MQSSGPSQGFTLVEVLVGISILSLVLLATVSGLRTLASTQLSLTAVATRNDELR
ncbi:MAG: prepilin-type N-terminal cleavage/methylation domain-containing protein, partial [Pseudomonadota bacterium]